LVTAEKAATGQWLSGEAETVVDSKGRVSIAQQLRKGFGQTAAVLYWPKDRLLLMPPENFDKLVEMLAPHMSTDTATGVRSFFNPKAQQDRRFFFGKKIDLDFDAQGRLTIPQNLRQDKNLNPETPVMVIGAGRYLELLTKKTYLADCALWEAAGGYENLFSDLPPLTDPQLPEA
jgi:division/cell wall cluster transcriptional repressor MraZ